MPSQPVRLLPRPAFLAGREGLLADLDVRLSADAGGGPRVAVLCGLGGAGKTSVAVEYAHRHLATLGVAWQFLAEDPTALAAGFSELAAQLSARDLLSAADPVTLVHGVLAARPGDWLLIFDNAPSPAAVQGFLPPAGHGRVLITSQDPYWPHGQALDVPVLDQATAGGFLLARTGRADDAAAWDLAGELGGLPLALEQAAAFMLATGHDIGEYLAIFRQRRRGLLARGEPAGYAGQVATTWGLALDQLGRSARGAVALLRLLACCAPELIPVRLLLQPRPELPGSLPAGLPPLLADPLVADDALAALRRFSLVGPPQDGLVSVHRLVQAVTIDQLPDHEAADWRQAARSLIETALPADPQQPGNWPAFAALLAHAQFALEPHDEGMARIASYLGHSGYYAAAQVVFQQIAMARERVLGPDHPDTLTTLHDFAHWSGEAGDIAAARDQYAALLPVREEVLGSEHPDTLTTRQELAYWTGQAGDGAAARDQYAALVPIRERVAGPEHPDTLADRGGLALWTGQAGDTAAARDQCYELLSVTERVLGPEHPRTLTIRGDLAHWTGKMGDQEAARDQFAALLPIREHVLGPEHPETLEARADLARCTGEAGDAVSARDQFAALLPITERVMGPENPDTVSDRAGLARWTGEAGDPVSARDQFVALLPITERVLGPEHPDTLTARAGLARWTGEAGDPVSARDQFAALLPITERTMGREHPDTVTIRADLARCTHQAGK